MEKRSAIVFIDGNNWYHNLKKYGFSKPRDIDFWKLSQMIASQFDLEIVDIIYYNSIPSIEDGEIMYYRHMGYLSSLEKEGVRVKTRKLQRQSTKEIVKDRKELLNSLELCANCKPLIEEAFIDSLGLIFKKEKGIDVMIAIDMITKCILDKECECCILISGDADFIPAIQLIKNLKCEVITASVPYGYSNQLRLGKFRYLILKKQELREKCMKSYKEIKK